jgi:hypothetical protein
MNMKNPNINMGPREAYQWGDKGIPTRENCDLNNPREMFLWMFTAVPGLNGAALMIPPDVFMVWSEHLYELGARLSAEPIKKYRRPTSNDPHWATSPGQWVPIDTPDPPVNPAKKAWDTLTPIQKAEIRALANAEHEAEPQ